MKCGVRQAITIICVTLCAKEFQIRTLIKAVIDEISMFFTEMVPNFTYSKKKKKKKKKS